MNGENAGRVIVALPRDDDPIRKHGNEDKHMTVVWLGKPEENPDLDMDQVRGQVEGVAQRSGPLTANIENVGNLGDDGALVAFVRSDGAQEVHDDLLNQSYIRDGFGAVEQHPQWTPHVTIGYPEGENADGTDSSDLPDQEQDVVFDRLAVWDGDDHTEYPLAAGPEEQPEPTPLAQPYALIDATSMRAAVRQVQAMKANANTWMTQRVLMKRARELGCQHVIPMSWSRETRITVVANGATRPEIDCSVFELKTEQSGL